MNAIPCSPRFGIAAGVLSALVASLPAQPAITNVVDVNTRQVLSHDGGRTWLDGGSSSRGSGSYGGYRRSAGPSAEQLRLQRQRELGRQEYQQGLARLQEGDFEGARAALYSAMERLPDDPEIPKALALEEKREAQAAAAKENWTWALTLYEYASHHNPNDPEVRALWNEAKWKSKLYYDQRSDALANERIKADLDQLTSAVGRIRSEPVMVGGGTIRFRSAGGSPTDYAAALAEAGFANVADLHGTFEDVQLRGLVRLDAWVEVPEEMEKEPDIAAVRTRRAMAAGEVVALQANLAAVAAERERGGESAADREELDAREATLAARLERMRSETTAANAALDEAVKKRRFYVAPVSN